jgi:hypothetical protein
MKLTVAFGARSLSPTRWMTAKVDMMGGRLTQVATLLSLLLTISQDTSASLAPTTFEDLVRDSSLIVIARSQESRVVDFAAGRAKLKTDRVLRGRWPGPFITLEWTEEVHDQRIRRVGEAYLLFLRAEGNRYVGTHYGRSYWPMDYTKERKEFIEYIYPVTYVKVPGSLLADVERMEEAWPGAPRTCTIKGILLDRVITYIEATVK